MSGIVRLLTILCFAWCALGIAEPVAAHGDAATHAATAAEDGAADEHGPLGTPEGHHHCPVAYDIEHMAFAAPAPYPALVLRAVGGTVLASLTSAPPLQPPAA